jgi:protein-disulfide isomerase
MDKNQKLLAGLAVIFIIYIAVSIMPLINYFKPSNYFTVNGKKFSESDLQKDKPALASKLKKEYVEKLKNTFEEFAFSKIMQMEAHEKNLSEEDLVKNLTKDYKPSQPEILAVFEQFKSQIGKKKIEEVTPDIISYLKKMKEQEFYGELSKKYKIEYFMESVPLVRQKVEEKNNPALGPKDAKVTIIEFSDFQCPWCQRSQGTSKQIREMYKDKIRWVFRDYYIVHPQAKFIHVAANCAIEENKYWELFSKLFENANGLDNEGIKILAKNTGLDMKKFDACMSNPPKSIEDDIQIDLADGKALGVNGTPAFFINGILVEGAAPLASFQKIIDEELSK